jgi:hypothetical protein
VQNPLWVGDAGGVGYMLVGREKKSPRRSSEGLKDNIRMILGLQKWLVQVEEGRKSLMAIADYKERFIPVGMA